MKTQSANRGCRRGTDQPMRRRVVTDSRSPAASVPTGSTRNRMSCLPVAVLAAVTLGVFRAAASLRAEDFFALDDFLAAWRSRLMSMTARRASSTRTRPESGRLFTCRCFFMAARGRCYPQHTCDGTTAQRPSSIERFRKSDHGAEQTAAIAGNLCYCLP